ncbi:hypothetical protein NA78x_005698 [Anatilimnocola sp. NA78]|uniref:hypothetical protein n=1 Tax=Anatilimnocola sp. NA78 TaxID=3415683 RepID=UPI003CE5802C
MSDQPLDATVEEQSDEQAVPVRAAGTTGDAGAGYAVAARATEVPASGASWSELRDNPKLLLSLLFFVTGALGLPLLWFSKAFSLRSKISLTFAVLAWTALLIWLTAQIVLWSYGRVVNSLQ